MTTVAYFRGVMAADTRCTAGDEIIPGTVRKVFRLKNGTLVGLAGNVADVQNVVRELRKNPDKLEIKQPKNGDEITALVVYTDGQVRELEGAGWVCVKAPFHAIGSGALEAKVAMRCGKSAAQAVKIASEFDTKTGSKVQTVKLK